MLKLIWRRSQKLRVDEIHPVRTIAAVSAGHSNKIANRAPTWAVADVRLEPAAGSLLESAFCEHLRQLGYPTSLVADGDPAGLEADILLFMNNLADFGIYRKWLAGGARRRPVTAVWMRETLPPESTPSEAESIGLAAARWHYRLGLLHPKDRLTPVQKLLTLRNLRHWLYKQLSGMGYRKACRLIANADPRLAETQWALIRGAMQNWECLYRIRQEGWLDHCIVSTQQRQRFLGERGWQAHFVPVGSYPRNGRPLGLPRDIDVVFLGYLRKDRRVRLLEQLKRDLSARGISIELITANCFGEDRTQLLNRTKILLMLHQYPWSPAWDRFVLAAQCGACVVSEPMGDDAPFRAGVHYATAGCDRMPALIEHLVRNDVERNQLVEAAAKLCTGVLTLHNSVRKIAGIITGSSTV